MRPKKLQRIRDRYQRLRDWSTRRQIVVRFYNLESWRRSRAAVEIRALLEDQPAILGLCECLGNELPPVKGYTLVRDTSTRSRENIAAYVRADLPVEEVDWLDLRGTWPRTEGPGTHEARSILSMRVAHCRVLVAHQPPKGAQDAERLQLEGLRALLGVMAPWRRKPWRLQHVRPARLFARLRPTFVLWDANRRPGEPGPGPDALAAAIAGKTYGTWIDNMVGRAVRVKDARKLPRVNGVGLDSDHLGAVEYTLEVPSWWLR